MSVAHRIYNFEDLEDTPDDGNRYEIIWGQMIVSPVPPLVHQEVLGRLVVWLTTYVWDRKLGEVHLGPVEVRLSPHNSVQPDIVFVSSDRFGIQRQTHIEGAPDLVVEVLSDHTRRMDLIQKQALYAMAGVPEYWIVDLNDRTLSVLTLVDGQYDVVATDDGMVRSLVVPGFEIAVADVFADLMGQD
ncbi:MAG: Uma2 family endonuclease [Chloroflexota bacterium]|nr:Uma2 family endonuclease [Chloroflexota bacterium]